MCDCKTSTVKQQQTPATPTAYSRNTRSDPRALNHLHELLQLNPSETTAATLRRVCATISECSFDNDDLRLFATDAVRDALVSLAPRAKTDDGVRSLSTLVCDLTVNDDDRRMFGTAAMCDALVSFAPRATTAESVQLLCNALSYLTVNKDGKKISPRR